METPSRLHGSNSKFSADAKPPRLRLGLIHLTPTPTNCCSKKPLSKCSIRVPCPVGQEPCWACSHRH